MKLRHAFPVLLLTLAAGVAGGADPNQPQPDIARFSKLPVRYNGRVSSVRAIAYSIQSYFKGAGKSNPTDVEQLDSVRWFLDVISNHDRSRRHPLFRVDNKDVLEQLNLGSDLGKPRFASIADVVKVEQQLNDTIAKALERTERQRSDSEKALVDLSNRTNRFIQLVGSFQTPWSATQGELSRLGRNSREADAGEPEIGLNAWVVPRMIPPQTKGDGWRSLVSAGTDHFAATEFQLEGRSTNAAAFALAMALRAYMTDDIATFNRRLVEFEKLLRSEHHTSPIKFVVPNGWIEVGVSEPYRLQLFADTYEWGFAAIGLQKRVEGELVWIHVNHFPQVAADITTTVNSWRVNEGLLPISAAAMQRGLTKSRVVGRECTAVDLKSPDSIPFHKRRVVSRILHHATGTWTLSIYGQRDDVEDSLPDFETFVTSFGIGEVGEVARWLNVEQPPTNPGPTLGMSILGAVIPDGHRHWALRLVGTSKRVAKHRATALEFLRSIRFRDSDKPPASLTGAIEYTLPDLWDVDPLSETGLLISVDPEDAETFALLQPLANGDSNPVRALANHWRKAVNLDEASAAAAVQSAIKLQVGNQTLTVFEFATPALELKWKSSDPTGEILIQPPAQWALAKNGQFSVAKFTAGANGEVQVTVSALGSASVGSFERLSANLNRWRQQVGLAALNEEQLRQVIEQIRVDGKDAVFVHLEGAANSVLGVIMVGGEKAWFVKMNGPKKLVLDEKK
ncbi:MAG: hypothetical protein O3A00_00245, partial [Planctomycetota bacterium]|nr:hypothetical protein [Planctomycetota bacterium]